MSKAFVIFDRDGTLIEHVHHLVDPKLVKMKSDLISSLTTLRDAGFQFGLITNQSVISRGLCSQKEVEAINEVILKELSVEGIYFEFSYICPHHPRDGCICRKPKTGLGDKAIIEHQMNPRTSYVIGDQESDMIFGKALGCSVIQVKGTAENSVYADYHATSLDGAANWILEDRRNMSAFQTIESRFAELTALLPKFQVHAGKAIEDAAVLIANAFRKGNKILICGNGGSAADSQHLAAEFVNSFSKDISRKALPAIALSTDSSVITSIANDYTFDNIFSRQIEAYASKGDVLLVLTTSGSSINCLNAIETSRVLGLGSIALTREYSAISGHVDICIEVPSKNTQHIQECHTLAYHLIAELVENMLFENLS